MSFSPDTGIVREISTVNAGATLTAGVTEIDLYRRTIDPKMLGTKTALYLELLGALTTPNILAALLPTMTLRFKYGSASLAIINAGALLSNMNNGCFRVEARAFWQDSRNAQLLSGVWQCDSMPLANQMRVTHAAFTVNSMVAQDLAITLQFSSLLATLNVSRLYSRLQIKP